MIEDEPLHDWHTLDEAGLRSWAAQYVGWATSEMSHPDDLSWTLDTGFPLDVFHRIQTDWEAYYLDEIADGVRYGDGFAELDYHTPVVLSVEAGEPIIWDGWHRIACAIHRGDDRIMAIVGRQD